MFSFHRKKSARIALILVPLFMSLLLLFGMMASNLFTAPREQAQAAAPAPNKIVVAQTATPAPMKAAVPKAEPPAVHQLSIVSTPNRNYRAAKSRHIDTIVIHYSSAINVDPARWDDPALVRDIFNRNHVSAHYLIARDGTVYKLVDEQNVAWQAGGSIMPAPDNRKNVNSFSIGIEIIATQKSGFTDAEYASLAQLVNGIRSRSPIRHIVGHDEIGGRRAVNLGLRHDVKPDPGSLFDWSRVPGR